MATFLQIGNAVLSPVKLGPELSVQADIQHKKTVTCFRPPLQKCNRTKVAGLRMKSTHLNQKGPLIHSRAMPSASVICASALNARCSAAQPQVLEKETTKIHVAPSENKSPKLADGGAGFPPRDDGGGGGGGGGGGWRWGGFFFFAFLAFLGYMQDKEDERSERTNRVRRSLNKY